MGFSRVVLRISMGFPVFFFFNCSVVFEEFSQSFLGVFNGFQKKTRRVCVCDVNPLVMAVFVVLGG